MLPIQAIRNIGHGRHLGRLTIGTLVKVYRVYKFGVVTIIKLSNEIDHRVKT